MLCKKCGTELIDGVCPRCTQDESNSEDDSERKIKKLLLSQHERVIAVLGKKYSEQYLTTEKCTHGFAVVSDEKIYCFGKSYNIRNNIFGKRSPRKVEQSKTIDIKDVTSMGESVFHYRFWQIESIVGFALIIIAIICILNGIQTNGQQTSEVEQFITNSFAATSVIATQLLLIGMLFRLVLCAISKIKMITVQYNGGEIAFDIADFAAEEIDDFRKKLQSVIDKAVEERHKAEQAVSPMAHQSTSHNSRADELVKMADLLSKGLISQEEFDKMKKELI